jgi:hypothetical protein
LSVGYFQKKTKKNGMKDNAGRALKKKGKDAKGRAMK